MVEDRLPILLASFANLQRSAFEISTVELGDSVPGFIAIGHLDKCKPFGLAGKLVSNDLNRRNLSVSFKSLFQFRFCQRVTQIANVNVHGQKNKSRIMRV